MDNPAAKGHSIWQFLLKHVVVIIVVVLLCLLAFHTARRVTNCTVMATEAMSARLNYAMGLRKIDDKALKRFFTEDMIKKGELTKLADKYRDFKISGYNDSTSVKWIWSWPGSDTAHVRVTEKVKTIEGEPTANSDNEDAEIPEWGNAVYLVTLERIDNKWLVDNIELEEVLPEETETPEPTGAGTATPPASQEPEDTTSETPASGTE